MDIYFLNDNVSPENVLPPWLKDQRIYLDRNPEILLSGIFPSGTQFQNKLNDIQR